MLRTRIDQALRVFIEVANAGVPVTGLVAGAFTVVVRNPGDSASSAPAVTESTALGGLYYFDVPATFWATNGIGMYKARTQVVAPGPALVLEQDIEVYDEGEVQVSLTWDATANTIRANTWLVRGMQTGVQNATLRIFDRTGAALVALQTAVAPDAQNVFAFNFTAPTLLIGETETYVVVTIEQLNPGATPVRTYTSRVGVTFSRTS